jgi:act minimal PKS acyl carrier protein
MNGTVLNVSEFIQILRAVAGDGDGLDLDGEIADVEFADLGYDSIALLETAGQIEREYGVTLDDETVTAAPTPREFVALVNAGATSTAAAA